MAVAQREGEPARHGRKGRIWVDMGRYGATRPAQVLPQGSEIEHRGQVANRWRIGWQVGVRRIGHDRIGQTVATAVGQRLQAPVVLNEFQDRRVVVIDVVDVALLGVRRHHEQRNAWAVTEEVQLLNAPAVEVAASFVRGDEDGGVGPQGRLRLHQVDEALQKAFVIRWCRIGRVARIHVVWHHKRDGRQGLALDVADEALKGLQVVAQCAVDHLGRAVEWVAQLVVEQLAQQAPCGLTQDVDGHVLHDPSPRVPLPAHLLGTQGFGNGGHGLRWVDVVCGPQGFGVAIDVIGWVVVVDQVVGASGAVVGHALCGQQGTNGRHPRLVDIRAVDVGAPAVAVLLIKIGGASGGVGVFNLVGRWRRQAAIDVVDRQISRGQGEEVHARATHDGLVVVVADGVTVGQGFEVGRVARGHVVKAHELTALAHVGGADGCGVAALPRGGGNPDEKVVVDVGAAGLLPHLKEAVHRISRDGVRAAVRHVLRDLERTVGQPERKPQIRQPQVNQGLWQDGLWQPNVAATARGVEGVGAGGIGGFALCSQGVVGARRTIGIDDALGQQVTDALPGLGLVGAKEAVEGVVLADDHNHVLDRRAGVAIVGVCPTAGADGDTGRNRGKGEGMFHGDRLVKEGQAHRRAAIREVIWLHHTVPQRGTKSEAGTQGDRADFAATNSTQPR